MKSNQLNLFGEELIIDNFAGGGGASEGIEQALARAVDIAINHDADALAMHKANHPGTRHLCDDVFKVDPRKACNGHRVGAAWFSPDCKDFSKAKGGKPVSKKIRGLAWVMVKWAAIKRPRVLFLENVEEFKDWGPLLKNGKRCPKRKGRTFKNFCTRLRNLGYEVDHRELRACDYGAPTSRKRLFLIARCDGEAIVWPLPTHGKPGTPDVVSGKIKPWRTAAECIDFSLPCPSIFLTKRGAKKMKLKVIRPLAPATMRRIARGIFKFVIENPKPFIVHVAHGETAPNGAKRWGQGAHSIDEPLGTVPASNAFAVVSPHITKFRTGATGSKLDDPLPTITAGPKENPAGAAHAMGLVTAVITKRYGARRENEVRAASVSEPMSTVTSKDHHELVAATLVPRYGERKGQAPRAMDVEKPMPTIVPTKNGASLVSAFLAKHYGGNETPGSQLEKPMDSVTTKDHHAVIAVHMATNRHNNVGGAADEPLKTLTTGQQQAIVTAHIERQFGESNGNSIEAPLGAITAGVNKSALVTSNLVKLRGTSKQGQAVDEPLHTISAGGTHHAEVRAFLTKYYTTGTTKSFAQDLNQPMHTIKGKACFGLVTVHGEDYVIVDIGMRMLEPRELFLAQGFPPDYVIDVVNGKKLPKNAQVRMCGNSAPPPPVKAIVEANVPDLIRRKTERAA